MGVSLGWLVLTSAVCSDWLFFLLIAQSGGKSLPGFSFVSGHKGLHDQGELKEGIRMLMADILPKCIAVLVFTRAPFVVTGTDYVKQKKIMVV